MHVDWSPADLPHLQSWVASANRPDQGFPLQNLPYGSFVRPGATRSRLGVAIGEEIFDLAAAADAGLLDSLPPALVSGIVAACRQPDLNHLMALGVASWSALRRHLIGLLVAGSPAEPLCRQHDLLVRQDSVTLLLPARIGDYTDFYASIDHATNVGSMFRPDHPLLPNYKYVPVAYHGRTSTIVPSGTAVRRPWGQSVAAEGQPPVYAPSRRLDYELELGFFVGPGNQPGAAISIDDAPAHLFGVCLVNDWSARDLQRWEYQPLGPFLAKNFATSISPWVVTLEALEPFRIPARPRPEGDPAPLPHLFSAYDQQRGGLDLTLEVWLQSEAMRRQGHAPMLLSRGNFRSMYWTLAQMLTHHASNGCALRPGDLLASGTVSGPGQGERGCLLELTWGGRDPVALPGGELRRFLEDGDEITLRAHAGRPGHPRISLGACSGKILPAAPANGATR